MRKYCENLNDKTLDMSTVMSIIKKYENYSSIIDTNNKVDKAGNRYYIPLAKAEQIIKKLNLKKAEGPGKISPKIVILSANIIDSHLANIINCDLGNTSFSESKNGNSPSVLFTKRMIDITLRILDLQVS